MVSDLSLALIHSGLSLEGLKVYTENHLRKPAVVKPPQFEAESTKPRSLAVNSSTSQPGYMHENLPSFPDKHTYIQTPAQRHATTDYQLVRQKESMQRKNLESALTKFIAKTGESNFYCDDIDNPINSTFQLIACNPSPLSYLSALLPKDEEEFEVFDLSMEQELFEPAAKKAKQDNSDSSVAAENSLMSWNIDFSVFYQHTWRKSIRSALIYYGVET